jgi:response regulator RpfG family c-di-GMP phosphodiesterase
MSAMSKAPNILVVDDEEYICDIIKESLSDFDYNVLVTDDPQKAIQIIESQSIDFLLTDLILGDKSGMEVLNKAIELHSDVVVVLMTGQPTIENAVSVLKLGAYDYLIKPFSVERLKTIIRRGLERQQLYRENVHLKEMVSLYQISQAMGSTVELDSLLSLILDTAVREFGANLASILLWDEKTKSLKPKASLGTTKGEPNQRSLSEKDPIIDSIIKTGQPQILDESNIRQMLSSEAKRIDIKSAISHPLLAKGKVIGVLNLIRSQRANPFTKGQLQSLSIIASEAASAIENSKLYENLKESYLETLTALANAVEARDTYTRGHTERVWYIAEFLAGQMGWEEERMWEVKMGGILHDIGKIGVPDAILNKPGKLTLEEFEIMKLHPKQGVKILEGISFLAPALPYVLYHHERYDGQGYPEGLAKEDIPIQGRLMAVVDTFDAISSDRPYRKSKGFEKALEEIKENTGTQFDLPIVEVLLDAWNKGLIDKGKLEVQTSKESFTSPAKVKS